MYSSLFREFLTYMMEDPRNIGACTHLLFMAKNIERIGDHATNIAENLYYLVHGTPLDAGAAERRQVEPRGRRRRSRRHAAMTKPLVLIVEDEAPLVTMLRYNLETRGVRGLTRPRTARRRCVQIAERRPDAVLLDWMLPLVSGHRSLPPHPALAPRPARCR